MKLLRRLAVASAAALAVTAFSATPARADHFLTVCDNTGDFGTVIYDSGPDVVLGGTLQIVVATGQTYVRYNDILVGVDSDPATVCVRGPLVGNQTFALRNAPAGYVGAGIQTCTWFGELGHGGDVDCDWVLAVFIDPVTPLFSCVYVNGVQQIPGCPLP